jgi:hypothetical protein
MWMSCCAMSARTCQYGQESSHVLANGRTYPGFEVTQFIVRHCVSLGDDRDEVDFVVELAHKLDVNLLEAPPFISSPYFRPWERTYEWPVGWMK